MVMKQLRPVSRLEKVFFPLFTAALIALLVPDVTPLMGMFMFGNLLRESGVVARLTEVAQGALMSIVVIFLGVSVGATMQAEKFLTSIPLMIFALGMVDFMVCTAGGILTVKLLNLVLKPADRMNPLIGAAGVSAVPMSARVVQIMGQRENPRNFLLMHAMGPNLAGVIGTAAAAGMYITMFKKWGTGSVFSWSTVMATLLVRFIGVFIVLGILQVAIALASRFVRLFDVGHGKK